MIILDKSERVRASLNFEDIKVGETFIIENGEQIQFIGMKVYIHLMRDFAKYGILSLIDGNVFENIEEYNIVRIIDLLISEERD